MKATCAPGFTVVRLIPRSENAASNSESVFLVGLIVFVASISFGQFIDKSNAVVISQGLLFASLLAWAINAPAEPRGKK